MQLENQISLQVAFVMSVFYGYVINYQVIKKQEQTKSQQNYSFQ
jgi:hypothetical protein